jgi:23S rRNA (cytosine1962-C5)-methyltransferase
VSLPSVQLKIRVRGRHPWFFRKMVRKPERPLPAGGAVHVADRDGKPVGTGFFNPRTDLALRMFAGDAVDDVAAHLTAALASATALREDALQLPKVTDAYRLVHAEADGLPALIIDRLGDAFVAQISCLGTQQHLETLGEWLQQRQPRARFLLLQDADAVAREGMERLPVPRPVEVEVVEHGLRYTVAAGGGHKTGFFADQRDNRRRVRDLAKGRSVLDLCCNAGGFAMSAAAGGARAVRAADLDEAAVAQASHNLKLNRLRADVVHGDAFDLLRALGGGEHDLIVLDPPKWVHSPEELETGMRRYQDLNRLGLQKLARGGILVSCSCSGSVSELNFLRMLREAATEAGRDARLLHLGGAGPDHPVALECQETRYLKVAFLQVR